MGAALFLAVVAAMGFWSYRLGTRDAAEVPVIRALAGPARVQPDDPGGLRAAHQGLEVNSVLAGRPAPTPEGVAPLAPPPSPLAIEDAPQGELVIAAPTWMPDAERDAMVDLRMPPAEDGVGMVAAGAPPDGEDVAAPVVDATSMAALVEAAMEPRADPGSAAEVAPGSGPLRRPANLARARTPAPVTPAAVTPSVAGPVSREVASVRTGARLVQLGAYDSEAITRQAWDQFLARNGDLLAAKSLFIERTTANARVFYRLRVAGFETSDQTRDMCEALRGRGVDCIPVTLQ